MALLLFFGAVYHVYCMIYGSLRFSFGSDTPAIVCASCYYVDRGLEHSRMLLDSGEMLNVVGSIPAPDKCRWTTFVVPQNHGWNVVGFNYLVWSIWTTTVDVRVAEGGMHDFGDQRDRSDARQGTIGSVVHAVHNSMGRPGCFLRSHPSRKKGCARQCSLHTRFVADVRANRHLNFGGPLPPATGALHTYLCPGSHVILQNVSWTEPNKDAE